LNIAMAGVGNSSDAPGNDPAEQAGRNASLNAGRVEQTAPPPDSMNYSVVGQSTSLIASHGFLIRSSEQFNLRKACLNSLQDSAFAQEN
jgi:hypothetical protein